VPTGTTWIAELKDGSVNSFELTPEAAGIARSSLADLKGGEAAENATALADVLAGKPSAFADAAMMTAGAALIVAGKATDIKEGVATARAAIASGGAQRALARLVEVSNS
jgi:anthranilate phosphoribosyltransferase